MTSHIDFRTMPANVPVLCIPRVYSNISESRIRRIFDDLNMGVLDRIDIVPKVTGVSSKASEKGEKFNRVFVHFRRWNDTENANIARERLLNGKEIKIIYDDPWFWKISAYREAERKPTAPQNAGQRRATLQFDSDEERASTSKPVTSYRRQEDRPDDRRRDDSRERRRPDDRRRPDSRERRRPDDRRRDDSRERRRPDHRYRDDSRSTRQGSPLERRRPDTKLQEDKKPAEVPKIQPRTPSCSPPRERQDQVNEVLNIDYGDITIPFRKKNFTAKALKIEVEREEGEIVDKV